MQKWGQTPGPFKKTQVRDLFLNLVQVTDDTLFILS
jgi:hypothetical protein